MRDIVFSVLGPVETRVGGRAVALGGGRQRALLVALLLGAGRVVSVDRLVDELWGDRPPASPRTQVHTLVHRVRRSLGEAGALIETRPPGYVLRTGSARVDLIAFTEGIERAREHARLGHRHEAVAGFREALRLWRGRPLDGADAAFVSREVSRLEELRLAATEECLGLELALGGHGAVVAELAVLVDEHPFRDGLRGRLMLALFRCGRRSEALEVYRDGRALLIEETGLEPTPPLRELHAAILRGEDPEPVPRDDDPEAIPRGDDAEPLPPDDDAGRISVLPQSPDERPVVTEAPRKPVVTEAPQKPMVTEAPRKRARLLGAGAALGLLVVVGGSAAADRFDTEAGTRVSRPQFVPGPAWVETTPKPVPSSFFGATIGNNSGAMPGFRIGSARFWDSYTTWADIEKRPGRFDWSRLDRMVDGAERAGLPMHYTMGMTPAWAAPDAPRSPYGIGSKAAPPDDLKHWDRYVRAVASRYRGRIGAYELWDYPNIPFRFTRDTATLVQMTNRAADIIEDVDPEATVVCPSIGELWSAAGRRYMAEFARLGGYGRCEAIAIKFHPRRNWGRPEEMTELAVHIDRTLHSVGVNLPIWATGPGHSISEEPKLGEDDANNYAVRYYLAGLYSRHYERMYFYSWGVGNIPLVLQVVKSRPTRAALFVERLQDWLDGASIRSCGLGEPDGLPDGVWQCRFQLPGPSGRPAEGAIRWTAQGAAVMSLEHDAYRIDHLDGRTVPVRGGQALRVTERPVLIRFRSERGPATGR